MLFGPCGDQRADVLHAPGGDTRTQLDRRRVTTGLHAGPPGRLADGNAGGDWGTGLGIPNNMWKPQEASFGKFSHFGSLSSGLVRGDTGGAKLKRIER
jgi:hypothetical protein